MRSLATKWGHPSPRSPGPGEGCFALGLFRPLEVPFPAIVPCDQRTVRSDPANAKVPKPGVRATTPHPGKECRNQEGVAILAQKEQPSWPRRSSHPGPKGAATLAQKEKPPWPRRSSHLDPEGAAILAESPHSWPSAFLIIGNNSCLIYQGLSFLAKVRSADAPSCDHPPTKAQGDQEVPSGFCDHPLAIELVNMATLGSGHAIHFELVVASPHDFASLNNFLVN